MRAIASAILALIDRGEQGALATVIRTAGSTPQVVGARLLLAADGTLTGTVGGGRIEEIVIEELRATLANGRPRRIAKHLGRDLGMCCGGEMEIFVERIEGRPALILFGAGHVARPTAALADRVGFDVWVVDDREELATVERFPSAHLVHAEPAEAIRRKALPFGRGTFVVVTTHDHRLDEQALAACLDQPRRYLGMIGSRRKVIQICKRILARHPEARFDGVHAPIGLDIGAHTPEEIAVSIVAELIAARRGAAGGSMKLPAFPTSLEIGEDEEKAASS